MRAKVKVILKGGREVSLVEWQRLYGLPEGSDKIGRYFSLKESRFINDLSAYGELIVNELLMRVLDGTREVADRPLTINSFNRNEEHQQELKQKGFKAATYSPHVVKMAADIDTKDETETRYLVKVIKQVADVLGIKVRIGFQQYLNAGQTFVHVDVCPEYYGKGKVYHSTFHPAAWENSITW